MKRLVFTETPVMCLNASACHEFLPQKGKENYLDGDWDSFLAGSLVILAVAGWFYFAFVPLLGIEKFLGFKIDWFWLWSSISIAVVFGTGEAVNGKSKWFLDFIGGFALGMALIPAASMLLFVGLMFLVLWLGLIFIGCVAPLILCAVQPKWFGIISVIIMCVIGVIVFLVPIVHWLI